MAAHLRAERRADERDAIEAIYGDDVMFGTETLEATLGDLRVRVALPPDYPDEPPTVALSGAPTRAVLADAHLRLPAPPHGECCVLEMLQHAEAAVADARAAAASPAEDRRPAATYTHCVVAIDHMNDRRGYGRRLRRLAARLRCALQSSPAAGGRHEGCVLVLQGDDGAIGAFLKDLRAERLDVDARGRRCFERCAAVRARRPMAASDTALGDAWREATYNGGRARTAAVLAACLAGDCGID